MSWTYNQSWGREPLEEPRYKYQIVSIWWPGYDADNILSGFGRDGWKIADIHWSGEKNEQGQEKIIYHLQWERAPVVSNEKWTITKEPTR